MATRVTVERPLRLRFRITDERRAAFLAAHPHLKDDLTAIQKTLGGQPRLAWNETWSDIVLLLKKRKSAWAAPEKKSFRTAFTETDPAAEPVIAEWRVAELDPKFDFEHAKLTGDYYDEKLGKFLCYEPDGQLRDFENVRLKEDVDEYFRREVLPHVPDAWMDRTKDKVRYELNFNRHFYRYTPPRPLEVIDADLKQSEENLMRLLKEVTR